jgi:hypothetical protein
LLRIGRNREAAEAFAAYQRKKPNTEKGRRAALNIALAQRNDGDLSASIATFQ